jgi:ribosomal protein S18 acetylase RimI-like enzyme
MSIEIAYATPPLIKSFWSTLGTVARELVYIEMVDAPEFSKTEEFQKNMMAKNWPAYYAIDGGKVVGWADISPFAGPRLCHRGSLGMGILQEYRGQGVGTRLLQSAVGHARQIGLEKVELTVYTSNTAAIALYRKLGFEQEGLIKRYRKLGDRYFDCLQMGLFL